MRGRDSLADSSLWRWADEGEKWLNEQFPNKGLEFHTMANIEKRTIVLTVYHRPGRNKPSEQVFQVEEPAESFVSHTTVAKIILIAG